MRFLLLFLLLIAAIPALAVEPDEILDDPVLEARAREIDVQLRCVVCQSQSIAESNAPLAKDLRILVRERLTAGDTNEEAIDYIVERYGDYVLLKPPFQTNTLFLWMFPAAILLAGFGTVVVYLRNKKPAPAAAPLSEEEEEKLQRIMEERAQ